MSVTHRVRSNHGKINPNKPEEARRPMVFVFGSNEAGVHGAGAARYALLKHGAITGQGYGHYGNSFALPTKCFKIKTLSLATIKLYVNKFIEYARAHPELDFQITQVGCGLAGLKPEWIAPMFLKAPENCYFDMAWLRLLPERNEVWRFWGTVP